MIVEAHGSFASQRCIECQKEYPDTLMKRAVVGKEVPRCVEAACNGLVKPDIVFFGEPLPEAFHLNRTLPASADLAIIMGTSLSVQPFASLPSFVREEIPRVLINLERVGGLGSRADDVLLLGECDDGVRKLAEALGWLDELEALWRQANPSKTEQEAQQLPPKTRDEKLEEEVDLLTRDIEKTLKLSKEHNTWLQDHLGEENDLEQNVPASVENTPSAILTTASHSAQDDLKQGKEVMNGSDRQIDEKEQSATNALEKDNGDADELASKVEGDLSHVFPHRDKSCEAPLKFDVLYLDTPTTMRRMMKQTHAHFCLFH